ncbi:uncharacterized protein LOC113311218 [Papaver somniferum]|uniref:uncharacterized protein LOC113311218 n=1 Tax=Papaver somniferum TaxID=3469 RepID=UPI000E700753|nr:uncharacterized protein LOC113311218 [Papaver somniferum]
MAIIDIVSNFRYTLGYLETIRLEFLVLWRADGYKDRGCFNMQCSEFVQVHLEHSFREPLTKGTYGKDQVGFDFSVRRDPKFGNWWFIDGRNNAKIGYWPIEIFTHLNNAASVIAYGGTAGSDPGKPYMSMGCGHLPDFDSRITSCMLQMKVADNKGNFEDFDRRVVQIIRNTKPSCYDIIFPGNHFLSGLMMLFGGPGGGDCH